MKYKVGDKVRIKSKEWFDLMPKTALGGIRLKTWDFARHMSFYCGETAIIDVCYDECYELNIDNHKYAWDDEMFEDSLELNMPKHSIKRRKFSKIGNVIY